MFKSQLLWSFNVHFRNEIKTVCESVNSVMVVSFGRKILGQTGSGHFAPVGKKF